jgi:hypothetical protein
MGTHIARVVPNTAILFLSYEVVNAFLGKRQKEQQAAREAAEVRRPIGGGGLG